VLDVLIARHLLIQAGRVGLALLLLLILGALGARLLRRVSISDPSERLVFNVAAGFAVYQFVVRSLAELPVTSPLGIALIVAALAAAGSWRAWMADLRALRLPWSPWWIAVLLLALPALLMALAPAVSRDAMIYHLRYPEMTLAAGTWMYDPANSSSFYPAAMGTLYLPALAADPNGVVAQLVNFGLFGLAIVAIAAVARRLGAATGAPAAVLFAATPIIAVVAGWAWADVGLVLALVVAALAVVSGVPLLALVFLGLAASIKYSAFLAGAPLFIAAVAVLIRRRAFRELAAGVLLAALVASPWYVTNVVRTGNPMYPLGSHDRPTGRAIATWSATPEQSWLDVWSGYFLRPQTLDEDVGGILFLVVAVIGWIGGFLRKELRVASSIVLAMWIVHLPLTTAMRLLMPAVTASLVLAGVVLERDRWRSVLIALFAIRGAAVTAAHNAHFLNPVPAAAGVETEQSYVLRNFRPAALFERARTRLPPDARVVAINEVRLFRFPRLVSTSRIWDPPLIRRFLGSDANATVARLRAAGVTHLLIGAKPVERGAGFALTRNEEAVVRAVVRASRLVDREGDVALFELP